jgi:DnaJ-class molecular chaperone
MKLVKYCPECSGEGGFFGQGFAKCPECNGVGIEDVDIKNLPKEQRMTLEEIEQLEIGRKAILKDLMKDW